MKERNSTFKEEIGMRLKELRKARKIKLKDIAAHLDIQLGTYTGWEAGRRSPNGKYLAQLADLYDTTVDYITGNIDSPTPKQLDVKKALQTQVLLWDGKEITDEQAEALKKVFEVMMK